MFSCSPVPEAGQPNILFIFADDWGYGDPGFFNAEVKMLNVDKLASQGTRFIRFHVTSEVCSPNRTSAITGLSSEAQDLQPD